MDILHGSRFGKLIVLERTRIGHLNKWYRCQCDCGSVKDIRSFHLTSGATVSCGCHGKTTLSRSTNLRHGHTRRGIVSKTWAAWRSMLQRCRDPNCKSYPGYGGRGIEVCERWEKFENFLADMGDAQPGLSLDRFPNNNGDYEPGNCRWATAKQQASNRRKPSTYRKPSAPMGRALD